MAPYPFQPMTTEQLKQLTRVNRDSDSTIKSVEYPVEFASQNLKTAIELNPQRSESDQSHLRTNNHY